MRVSHVALYPASSFIVQSSKGHVGAEQQIFVLAAPLLAEAAGGFHGLTIGLRPLVLNTEVFPLHGAVAHEDFLRRFQRDRGFDGIVVGSDGEHELNVHSAQDVDAPVAGDQEIHHASDGNSV